MPRSRAYPPGHSVFDSTFLIDKTISCDACEFAKVSSQHCIFEVQSGRLRSDSRFAFKEVATWLAFWASETSKPEQEGEVQCESGQVNPNDSESLASTWTTELSTSDMLVSTSTIRSR